jgi:hypothetical protein
MNAVLDAYLTKMLNILRNLDVVRIVVDDWKEKTIAEVKMLTVSLAVALSSGAKEWIWIVIVWCRK